MNIKNDPAIKNLLKRIPENVQKSFTEEQLVHLKTAIGARQWGSHLIDSRGVLKFFRYRYYYVILAGRNRRQLSASEIKASRIAQSILVSICLFVLLIFLYLIKSVLGIDLFQGFSFGFWDYFKELFS